jgi:hypothetical protein
LGFVCDGWNFLGKRAVLALDGVIIWDAAALQWNGTPPFPIGRTTADGVEGPIMIWAHPFAVFDAKFRELASAK